MCWLISCLITTGGSLVRRTVFFCFFSLGTILRPFSRELNFLNFQTLLFFALVSGRHLWPPLVAVQPVAELRSGCPACVPARPAHACVLARRVCVQSAPQRAPPSVCAHRAPCAPLCLVQMPRASATGQAIAALLSQVPSMPVTVRACAPFCAPPPACARSHPSPPLPPLPVCVRRPPDSAQIKSTEKTN